MDDISGMSDKVESSFNNEGMGGRNLSNFCLKRIMIFLLDILGV